MSELSLPTSTRYTEEKQSEQIGQEKGTGSGSEEAWTEVTPARRKKEHEPPVEEPTPAGDTNRTARTSSFGSEKEIAPARTATSRVSRRNQKLEWSTARTRQRNAQVAKRERQRQSETSRTPGPVTGGDDDE